MWAARPHLANIFEKLLDQKTFILPAARCLQPILKKTADMDFVRSFYCSAQIKQLADHLLIPLPDGHHNPSFAHDTAHLPKFFDSLQPYLPAIP